MKAYLLRIERMDGRYNPRIKGITLSENEKEKWINRKFKTMIPSAIEVRLFSKSENAEIEA